MKLSILVTLVASAQAFTMMPVQRAPMTQLNLLAKEDIEALFVKGEECMDAECDVDSVSNLLEHLKAQEQELKHRVGEIKGMVSALENVNQADEREVDEIRETVRAIYRIFQLGDKASGNDYPALSKPMGYSGEVGKGPTTAYDALPPKKYKP